MTDPVLVRVGEGAALTDAGRIDEARHLLGEVWDELGPTGAPGHRAVAARALAAVADDDRTRLDWLLRALLAADQVSERRLAVEHVPVAAVYGSLHADLAEVYARLGEPERAALHRELASTDVIVLDAVGDVRAAGARR